MKHERKLLKGIYISDILLNHNSSVEEDINLIVKLDEYTKQTNKRNYNKELICVL